MLDLLAAALGYGLILLIIVGCVLRVLGRRW